jgi:hypothetical protein
MYLKIIDFKLGLPVLQENLYMKETVKNLTLADTSRRSSPSLPANIRET